jgi:glycosyltransferase involved in cell wall biosynthesis
MRVLHVVATGRRRGGEVSASDLARALDRAGVAQRVAIVQGSDEPDVDFGREPVMLGAGTHRLPGLRVDLRALRRLRELIRHWAPDVVQTHGGESLKYALLTGLDGGRVVYRRIGSVEYWLPPGPRRAVHTALVRRAARIVAVAESVRAELIASLGLPPERVLTIPNGVDPRRLAPTRTEAEVRACLRVEAGAPVVVSVGALTEEKDPLGHLHVMAAALERIPAAVGLFAGDGPLRADLEEEVRRHGLGGRILVLGSVEHVGDLLAAGDVLLLASRTEGMPACVIEAGMAGVPAVAYAVAGVPEAVRHGETGLLARPGDPGGLADNLVELLTDAGRRQAMGGRASAVCHGAFGIDQIARRYLDVYTVVSAEAAPEPPQHQPPTWAQERS